MHGSCEETAVIEAGPTRGHDAARRVALCSRQRTAGIDAYDLAAALLLGTLLVLLGATFGAYAISNDEEVQQRYGELIVAYYQSGFADQALFHFKDLYLYGGLFDVVAVGLEKLLPLHPYAVRHVLSALTGVGGIAAVWATARAIAGTRAGLLAAAAIAVCGTWYGAMFNHTKDIPFAAAMMGATYFLLRIGRELPRPRWHLVASFGVLCGCALGIRVLGLFLLGYAGLVVLLHAPIGRGKTRRDVATFIARSTVTLIPGVLIAYAIMIAAWPWAALAPLNPLRALFTFADLHYPIYTMLAGHIYRMNDVPRWYAPTYIAIKLTLPLLIGAGLALVFALLPQRIGGTINNPCRKEIAFVAVAASLPLLCDVAVRGSDFTGMRHFLFLAPPIAVLAGAGLNGALDRLAGHGRFAMQAALALVLLALVWDASRLYRLHPDEYLFYNPLVGGLAGASRRYATDYWVNIMPEAVADLERYLDRTEGASGHALRNRRYLVVVCGERLPFENRADARLQWARDWHHADFFIAPTHMNCDRALEGRAVATIKRLGVPIGVVKDLRSVSRQGFAQSLAPPVHPAK
jgi:hypothetical protein